ncbi:hemerythrin domain-containing protein [Pseudomonadota bacterium]
MNDIMKGLHQDHAQFARLMSLLERELDRFHNGDEPAFDLLIDLLDYIGNYADCVHHPSENWLFQLLMERTEEGQELVAELMEQHHTLASLTKEFRHALEAITQDAVIRRDEVEQKGRDYIELQRQHLKQEEREVFPLLEQRLTADDWLAVTKVTTPAEDPMRDGRVQNRYQALYDYLDQELRDTNSGAV